MKAILSLIISGALVVSGHSQTRNVLVGTNNAVVQPTNFWSADASNARTGLGLGSAATNPASAFQPSSTVLSNLASGNGVNLTNIAVSNVVGALATNGNATNLTNFPASLLRTNGNAAGLTNITAANIAGVVALASNITGTIAISNGGSGATTAGEARTNLGLGWSALTNTNAATSLLGFTTNGQVILSTNIIFTNAITIRTNLSGTNIEILNIGDTNTGFKYAGGSVDDIIFQRDGASIWSVSSGGFEVGNARFVGDVSLSYGAGNFGVLKFEGIASNTGAAISRTNLGLGWSALTNTNAGTGLVSVNTNGEVVSPTNFWQVAPINTRVQLSQPVVNATNAATNARNLYLYSLVISTTGVTNTITLPTNSLVFLGDVATVIHDGPTSSVTAIRQIGSATNLITLNQVREAVKFIYESGGWRLADNISYVEPIQFSGTNASANAAASRTNLGLGATWLTNTNVTNFRTDIGLGATWLTNTNVTNFRTAIGLGPTNSVVFGGGSTNNVGVGVGGSNTGLASDGVLSGRLGLIRDGNIIAELSDNNPFFGLYYPITFQGGNAVSNAATTRTNLGIPLAALTNTNNATFQQAIFTTNAAPTNAGTFGDHVAWMGVSIVTNGVTNTFLIPLYK